MSETIEKENKIESMIYEIRGVQVMLDSDLAKLYECANGTKSINQAVKRHLNKFPQRYMFQLNKIEYEKKSPLTAEKYQKDSERSSTVRFFLYRAHFLFSYGHMQGFLSTFGFPVKSSKQKIFQCLSTASMPSPGYVLQKQIKALTGTSKTGAGMFDFCGP